jgi:hypothetical protein
VIAGSDRYADGRGGMDWRILGLFRVAQAEGPDVSRSSGRSGGRRRHLGAHSLASRFGVTRTAAARHNVTASYQLGDEQIDLR